MSQEKEKENPVVVVFPFQIIPKPYVLLALSGIIGVGKTRLADDLGKYLSLPVYHEITDGETTQLQDFYKDMKTRSFALELHLLNKRYIQQKELQACNNLRGGIQDRSIYEDAIFAHTLHKIGYIRDFEYEVYKNISGTMYKELWHPTILIHLNATPEEALARIKNRGRDFESGIDIEYLKALSDTYEMFLSEISRYIRVVRLDWHVFKDTNLVVKHIMEHLLQPIEIKEIHF